MRTSLVLLMLVCFSACDFLSTASELTFGEGSLPAMEQEMKYPSVDELIDTQDTAGQVGVPSSLNAGTMAHLVGALGANGECGKRITQGNLGKTVLSAYFELAACTEDARCADLCPEGFLGLHAKMQIELLVMKADQAKEIGQLLSEDNADAITQLRFQIKRLEFFQGEGTDREETTSHIKNFEMWLGAPDVEPLQFLGADDLHKINESAQAAKESEEQVPRFERYELPRTHPTTQRLIELILEGKDVTLTVAQSFQIDRDSLYELKISPAGVFQSLQPEIVVNAVEATTATLTGGE